MNKNYKFVFYDIEVMPEFAYIGFKIESKYHFINLEEYQDVKDFIKKLIDEDYVFVGFNIYGYDNIVIKTVIEEKLNKVSDILKVSNQIIFGNNDTKSVVYSIANENSYDLNAESGNRAGGLKWLAFKHLNYVYQYKLDAKTIEESYEYNKEDLDVTERLFYREHSKKFDEIVLISNFFKSEKLSLKIIIANYVKNIFKYNQNWRFESDLKDLNVDDDIKKVILEKFYSTDEKPVYIDGFSLSRGGVHFPTRTDLISSFIFKYTKAYNYDFSSFYPHIYIQKLNFFDKNTKVMLNEFLQDRLKHKHTKDTTVQKLFLNSIYGVLRKTYPSYGFAITLIGSAIIFQSLRDNKIQKENVIELNTDGFCIKKPLDVIVNKFEIPLEHDVYENMIHLNSNNKIYLKNSELKGVGAISGSSSIKDCISIPDITKKTYNCFIVKHSENNTIKYYKFANVEDIKTLSYGKSAQIVNKAQLLEFINDGTIVEIKEFNYQPIDDEIVLLFKKLTSSYDIQNVNIVLTNDNLNNYYQTNHKTSFMYPTKSGGGYYVNFHYAKQHSDPEFHNKIVFFNKLNCKTITTDVVEIDNMKCLYLAKSKKDNPFKKSNVDYNQFRKKLIRFEDIPSNLDDCFVKLILRVRPDLVVLDFDDIFSLNEVLHHCLHVFEEPNRVYIEEHNMRYHVVGHTSNLKEFVPKKENVEILGFFNKKLANCKNNDLTLYLNYIYGMSLEDVLKYTDLKHHMNDDDEFDNELMKKKNDTIYSNKHYEINGYIFKQQENQPNLYKSSIVCKHKGGQSVGFFVNEDNSIYIHCRAEGCIYNKKNSPSHVKLKQKIEQKLFGFGLSHPYLIKLDNRPTGEGKTHDLIQSLKKKKTKDIELLIFHSVNNQNDVSRDLVGLNYIDFNSELQDNKNKLISRIASSDYDIVSFQSSYFGFFTNSSSKYSRNEFLLKAIHNDFFQEECYNQSLVSGFNEFLYKSFQAIDKSNIRLVVDEAHNIFTSLTIKYNMLVYESSYGVTHDKPQNRKYVFNNYYTSTTAENYYNAHANNYNILNTKIEVVNYIGTDYEYTLYTVELNDDDNIINGYIDKIAYRLTVTTQAKKTSRFGQVREDEIVTVEDTMFLFNRRLFDFYTSFKKVLLLTATDCGLDKIFNIAEKTSDGTSRDYTLNYIVRTQFSYSLSNYSESSGRLRSLFLLQQISSGHILHCAGSVKKRDGYEKRIVQINNNKNNYIIKSKGKTQTSLKSSFQKNECSVTTTNLKNFALESSNLFGLTDLLYMDIDSYKPLVSFFNYDDVKSINNLNEIPELLTKYKCMHVEQAIGRCFRGEFKNKQIHFAFSENIHDKLYFDWVCKKYKPKKVECNYGVDSPNEIFSETQNIDILSNKALIKYYFETYKDIHHLHPEKNKHKLHISVFIMLKLKFEKHYSFKNILDEYQNHLVQSELRKKEKQEIKDLKDELFKYGLDMNCTEIEVERVFMDWGKGYRSAKNFYNKVQSAKTYIELINKKNNENF